MQATTAALWAEQDRHAGDAVRLFCAVREYHNAFAVLYPGSYVDVAASVVFPSVTYVDTDDRAARFFGDRSGVEEIIAAHAGAPADPRFEYIQRDYTLGLRLPREGFDLLVSLSAGFVSPHCTEHLRIGGLLLVNPSHGDAALAAQDVRYDLAAVVQSRSGSYRVVAHDLGSYLVPKGPPLARDAILARGRGVAYTRRAFAYLFRRTS